jgi:hypothetical protein
VSFFREADRVCIAGDAFITTKQESLLAVLTQEQMLHGPPAYATTDWNAARESVRRLAALRPAVAATGHGVPMFGQALDDGLQRLAADFDHIAVPRQGLYVHGRGGQGPRGVDENQSPLLQHWPALMVGAAALGGLTAARVLKRLRTRISE